MRIAILVLLLAAVVVLEGQPSPDLDPTLRAQLDQLFPDAAAFSPKEGAPPHFKAFVTSPGSGEKTLAGFAFWTTDLEPLERGYDGPIQILVGVDLDGILTGIVVVRHHEPYGYFSVDTPQFAAQFARKNIRDRFRVGTDIDAVSTATLTVTSATRAVRNAARRIARQYLVPSGSK
jgi:NosR/NirI family nitrous oxide reductase transcriptional regulator